MIIFAIAVFGLALGSFVNALVWRLRQQELKPKSKKFSVVRGRSMCPSCKHQLETKDLVPVLSWLSLKGRCRYCKKPISAQYPLVEAATALCLVISYVWWPDGFVDAGLLRFVVWEVILVGLVALFVYDLKWMILPNRILFPLIALAAGYLGLEVLLYGGLQDQLRHVALGLLCGAGIFWALFAASKGRWIGGGDVKLGILMGLMLGPQLALLAIFTASLLGSFVSIVLMSTHKLSRNQQVPFGPYLILGFFIAVLWGQSLVDWYSASILLTG